MFENTKQLIPVSQKILNTAVTDAIVHHDISTNEMFPVS